MANFKYITYSQIGSVYFEKSKKARRVVISIKSQNNVRVAVPRFVSFRRAESFVRQKLVWIKNQQTKISEKTNATEQSKDVSIIEKSNIINRVVFLANKYGFEYNKIKLRKMKTRWGSCTHNNNISLNIGLVVLTDELKDYIILHELVHTKIKNHSQEFWTELSKYVAHPKLLNRMLSKNYGLY